MILVVDTYIDGKKEIHEVDHWSTALDLFQTASECAHILRCSIRDIRRSRFLSAEFVRPGINNFLRMRSKSPTEDVRINRKIN